MTAIKVGILRRQLCSFLSAVIPFVSFPSFAPRSDATTQLVDASADPSPDFSSLLLTLFSPGVTQSQTSPVESAAVLSSTPEFAEPTFPFPESFTEDDQADGTAAPSDTVPFAQSLLLAIVTPFLWGNGQTVAETSATTQTTPRNLSSLLPAVPSAPTSVTEEMNDLNIRDGKAEETFSNPASWTIPFPNQADMVSAVTLNNDMAAGVAVNVDGQETENVETPPQPTANGGEAMGAVGRGVSARSHQPLDAAREGKQGEIFLQKFELPTEGEQVDTPTVTPGEQNPKIVKSVEMENSSLSANVNRGETPPIPTTPKDVRLPGNVKTTSSQPEFASVEQHRERNPLLIHNEQLITEPSPHGKAREAMQNSSQLTAGSPLAPNSLGSMQTVALQPQPEGATGTRNVKTWREVVDQVRASIVTNIEQSNREAHIQLDPPELGKLAIQLVMEGEHIRAHIVAESADVSALIQSHLPELKQALQSHRLDLDTVRVEVQTGGGEPNTSSRNPHQEERASPRGGNLSVVQADTRNSETALLTPPVDHRGGVNVWA